MSKNVDFRFISKALESEDTFSVIDFSGFEGISKPYEFTINLKSKDFDIDYNAILNKPCRLSIKLEDHQSDICGVLSRFEQLQQIDDFAFYRAVLVPSLWKLSLYRTNEVYIDLTVPEMIETVLEEGGFVESVDYELKLSSSYEKWDYRCQYGESHLSFIERLMEHEGIYYYFEQSEEGEKLIICDNQQEHTELATPELAYAPITGLDQSQEKYRVHSFICKHQRMPHKLILKDYNYQKPSIDIEGQAIVDENGVGEVFIYGENFNTPEEGARLAGIRSEEILTSRENYHGEGMEAVLSPGYLFTLQDHFKQTFNRDYLVIECEHIGHAPGLLADIDSDGAERQPYMNTFTAIPADIQFRPQRKTQKPKFYGTINAIIDAEGAGQYAEIDPQGRYKVILPFDRVKRDQGGKASCWIRMAQPYGGVSEGMHFPLRKGTEVLLTFINGDPDQPVISGVVPNAMRPSVVTGKNQTRSMIKSSAGNMIEMEDRADRNRIKFYSPKGKTYFHMGASNHPGDGWVVVTRGIERKELLGGQQITLMADDEKYVKYGTSTETTHDSGGSASTTTDEGTGNDPDLFNEHDLYMFDAKDDEGMDRDNEVLSITVDNAGSGYTSAPTVSISGGGGSGAKAVATLNGTVVDKVRVTNGGNGYTSLPGVSFSGGGGTGASATASISGTEVFVSSVAVTNGGSGYESTPNVSFSGGGGSGATAEAEIKADAVAEITVSDGGNGYTQPPDVSIDGDGTGATAEAEVDPNNNYCVSQIKMLNEGSGYTTAPTVTIIPQLSGGGSGASATATLGKVKKIKITNHGSGYTSAPTVSISGGGQNASGATATAKIDGKMSRNTELCGKFLIERRLGDKYFYWKGNEYHYGDPDNRRFFHGNRFDVTHRDESGDSSKRDQHPTSDGDKITSKTLIDDLTSNYVPTNLQTYEGESASWNELKRYAHVSMAYHDTVKGQKGNIYDFGGYWNYNLGNSYAEDHINQQAELNRSYKHKFPKKHFSGSAFMRRIVGGAASWVIMSLFAGTLGSKGKAGFLIVGGAIMGVLQVASAFIHHAVAKPGTISGKEGLYDLVEGPMKPRGATGDDTKIKGKHVTLDMNNTWVSRKYATDSDDKIIGGDYEYSKGDSITINIGDQEEHVAGDTYTYTYGGRHEEVVYSGTGIMKEWSGKGLGGDTWVVDSFEMKYDGKSGMPTHFEAKIMDMTFEADFPSQPTFKFSVDASFGKTHMHAGPLGHVDIDLGGVDAIKIESDLPNSFKFKLAKNETKVQLEQLRSEFDTHVQMVGGAMSSMTAKLGKLSVDMENKVATVNNKFNGKISDIETAVADVRNNQKIQIINQNIVVTSVKMNIQNNTLVLMS